SIDDDAHRDRLGHDVVGKFQASTACGEQLGIAGREDTQEVAWNLGAVVIRTAAQGYRKVDRFLSIDHAVQVWIMWLELLSLGLEILADSSHQSLRFGADSMLQTPG